MHAGLIEDGKACAVLGVSPKTLARWERENQAPAVVVRLLRLLCGELGALSTEWHGWRLAGDRIYPPGCTRGWKPGFVLALPYRSDQVRDLKRTVARLEAEIRAQARTDTSRNGFLQGVESRQKISVKGERAEQSVYFVYLLTSPVTPCSPALARSLTPRGAAGRPGDVQARAGPGPGKPASSGPGLRLTTARPQLWGIGKIPAMDGPWTAAGGVCAPLGGIGWAVHYRKTPSSAGELKQGNLDEPPANRHTVLTEARLDKQAHPNGASYTLCELTYQQPSESGPL